MIPPVFNARWGEDVLALHKHDMQEMWDPTLAPHMWNQYHNQLDTYIALADKPGPLDILDVGCAQGTLALILAELDHRVCAMDIRQPFLNYAASRFERGEIRFLCGNAMEVSPEATFDLIFANQIIEHLVYPFELVKRLAGWLKPGGRLVMATPNGDYFLNRLPSFGEIGDPAQYRDVQYSADSDGHFFAYRPEELAEIFCRVGLGRVQVRFFETPWISGHVKIRYLHPLLPVAPLRGLDRMTLSLPGIGRRLAHQLLVIGEKAEAGGS